MITVTVLVEGIGFLAAALVFAAFFMTTIIPLRIIAILSNFVFASYGYFADSPPIFLLHLAL